MPGELKLLLGLKVGEGSRPPSVRGFLFGYRAGGLYVDVDKAGSRGPGWNRLCRVGGVSGGDVIVPFKTCNTLVRDVKLSACILVPFSKEAAKAFDCRFPGTQVIQAQSAADCLSAICHCHVAYPDNRLHDQAGHRKVTNRFASRCERTFAGLPRRASRYCYVRLPVLVGEENGVDSCVIVEGRECSDGRIPLVLCLPWS